MSDHPTKITFGEMRKTSATRIIVFCKDYRWLTQRHDRRIEMVGRDASVRSRAALKVDRGGESARSGPSDPLGVLGGLERWSRLLARLAHASRFSKNRDTEIPSVNLTARPVPPPRRFWRARRRRSSKFYKQPGLSRIDRKRPSSPFPLQSMVRIGFSAGTASDGLLLASRFLFLTFGLVALCCRGATTGAGGSKIVFVCGAGGGGIDAIGAGCVGGALVAVEPTARGSGTSESRSAFLARSATGYSTIGAGAGSPASAATAPIPAEPTATAKTRIIQNDASRWLVPDIFIFADMARTQKSSQ
ncbi:hypothetical protein [Bradyrhizobium viridifuturi]|uniref:hypothetical protein n=1 Tax=Bradyrhizobium viridifuturi TaxID=1654716 RepID=UPI000FE13F46|nr:hypothetical protein [Bradyrhizobium viridifuturi]